MLKRCIYIPRVSHQKRHLGVCDGVGGDDQVAFVLAVLRVEDDDELAIFCHRYD